MTKDERKNVLAKYNGHCAYCGCEIDMHTMQVDHIKPILRGWKNADEMRGADDISNYNPSCAACNRRKGTLDVEEFRVELEQCHQLKQIPDGTIDAVICDLYDKGYTVSFVFIQISVETLNQRRN